MCRVYTSTVRYLTTVDTGMCRVYTSTVRYLSTVDIQRTLFPTKRGHALDLIQTPANFVVMDITVLEGTPNGGKVQN